MEIPNIFSTGSGRPDRKKKLKEIREKKYLNPSCDFLEYGYDYFDNAQVPSGYRFYLYDGSFKKPVNNMITTFHITNGMKVADYGCAKGYLLHEFKEKGFTVIGFEKSKYAIQKAHPGVKADIVQCCDPQIISDYEFDFLICRNVIPHLDKAAITTLIELAILICSQKPYFVFSTYADDKNKEDYISWDLTQKTIMNANQWRAFMEPFHDQIYFSLDCLI